MESKIGRQFLIDPDENDSKALALSSSIFKSICLDNCAIACKWNTAVKLKINNDN